MVRSLYLGVEKQIKFTCYKNTKKYMGSSSMIVGMFVLLNSPIRRKIFREYPNILCLLRGDFLLCFNYISVMFHLYPSDIN